MYVKPGVSFTFEVDEDITLYGKGSAVSSYTWGTDPFDARNTGRTTLEEGYAGLRIDLVLASRALAERCAASYVDIEPRRQERPSDHAPAIAEFDTA